MSEKGEGEKEYLTAREAVQYLAEKWGVESYSMTAFRVHRFRHKLEPDLGTENSTLWKRETLDNIPKPRAKRKREPKQQREEKSDDVA